MSTLDENEVVWDILDEKKLYSYKYNAGAKSQITKCKVKLNSRLPWYIRSNIPIYKISLKDMKLLFLPQFLLIIGESNLVIHYDKLKFECNVYEYVEEGKVPKDAEVVRYNAKYVNKDGSPDLRFSCNPRFPVCKYGEFWIKDKENNIDQCLMLSNYKTIVKIINKILNKKTVRR